ncbi:MAG: TIR domain-containing protein [Acidobacteria bacterium]|nr:TIR domain-containing protein [Acidobacteriota bacterium]
MPDFFVSFTQKDQSWAEWIAWQLEEAGYSVRIEVWDFTPGSNWVDEMQQAIKDSDRTIAVLSPDYLSSKFGKSEWYAAFAKDPTGEQRKLVPVRVREVQPDGLLGSIVYVDLVGIADEAEARSRLLSGVASGRAKPRRSPIFPALPAAFPGRPKPPFPGKASQGFRGPAIEVGAEPSRPKRTLSVLLALAFLTFLLSFFVPANIKEQLKKRLPRWVVSLPGEESPQVRQEFIDTVRLLQEEKDYQEARRRFLELRKRVSSEESREIIGGVVIATYYGEGHNREGLQYCQLYSGRPPDDVRYRAGMHAFLRRIALSEDYQAAELTVSQLRAQCKRRDLSYVWAGIPLGKAEYLWEGYTTFDESYKLHEEDKKYLLYVTKRYPFDEFLDHAFYFLGDFERVIEQYPRSTILDVVYRAAAQKALDAGQWDLVITYLKTVLDRWPASKHTGDVVSSLAAVYRQTENFEALVKLRHDYPFDDESPILDLLGDGGPFRSPKEVRAVLKALRQYESKGKFAGLFETHCLDYFSIARDAIWNGRFKQAFDGYAETSQIFREFSLEVPSCVSVMRDVLNKAAGGFAGEDAAHLYLLGLHLRNDAREGRAMRSLYAVAIAAWKKCATSFPDSQEAQKSLYLAAALERRSAALESRFLHYQTAATLFERLARQYPESPLADDALTEVGWYYLEVLNDHDRARPYFERVAREYPKGNAADNALNWLAISYYRKGEYERALETYRKVAEEYPLGRLASYARTWIARLQPVVASKRQRNTIVGVDLGVSWSQPGLFVRDVTESSPAAKAGLTYGDLIKAVDGVAVQDRNRFYTALAKVRPGNSVVLTVVRERGHELKIGAPVGSESYYALKP